LGALASPAAAVEKQVGPPPWRAGGRLGFTCDVAGFPDSSGYHLEGYLRLPPATLHELSRDASGPAQGRATRHLSSRPRDPESTQDFTLSLADTALGQGQVLLMRFPVAPGTCKIGARLEDLNPHKRGLQNITLKTELQGSLDVPKPQAGRDLSDIEFVWPLSAS